MYTKEEAIKKTLQDIEAMEAANIAVPMIKKVVEKWNGKVINKRFNDDLQSIGLPGHIYFSTNYETLYEVHYRPEKSNDWFTILSGLRPSCKYYEKEKSFVDPDKRISMERSFENIEERRIERLKKITAYREHLETWEVKKKQIDELKKQLKTIADSIPYAMQDYFDMRVKYY